MFQRTAGKIVNRWVMRGLFGIGALFLMAVVARAADPGGTLPATSDTSDQKLGSVLVFPYYTSSATPNSQNTSFTITNQSLTNNVTVRLYFVAGNTGAVSISFLCMTTAQISSFLASTADPGTTGYLVAVSVDAMTGAPVNLNTLCGEADVKLSTGHHASYKAEALAAINLPLFSGGTATLNFDGSAYNRMPRTLAINKIRSRSDGNNTLLVLTRVTGNYTVGGSRDSIGALSGNLFNDTASASTFSFNQNSPQLVQTLSNAFPPTAPPLDTVIPAGRTGWLHVAMNADAGLFGVVLNFNANTGSSASAFTGGHHLRFVTLSTSNSITIPTTSVGCP